MFKILLLCALGLLGLYLLIILPVFAYRFVHGKMIAGSAVPFSVERGTNRILVIGDSSAVGVGVSNPEYSTAGRLAKEYPNHTLINLSKNGSKLKDALSQLQRTEGDFDLVLIQAGGNNVIYFENLETSHADAKKLLDEAVRRSSRVVMLSTGNMGLAPIFPFPLNRVMTERTRIMRQSLIDETKPRGVAYVDLFEEKENDPFKDTATFYALDRLHLSDDGYGYWYSRIRATMNDAFPDFK